jgi:hypothetical protein
MQRWMQVFSTRKEKKRHLHDLSNSGSVNEGLPCKHLLDPWHHQSMGRRLDESEAATCASHGSYGPPMRPNHLNTTWAPRTALRTHLTATWRKHKTRGPTQGSADPTGRPNRLWLGSSWPFTCALLVVSLTHSEDARGVSWSWPTPINRREEG